MCLGCTLATHLHFLSRAWTRSESCWHKPIIALVLCFLFSLLTQADWSWLLLQRWLYLLAATIRLLCWGSCILANLLLLLIISLLSSSVVCSLRSSSLVLLVISLIMLLILRICCGSTPLVYPLIILITTTVSVTMSSTNIIWFTIWYCHLGATTTSACTIFNSLSSLSIIILSIGPSDCNIFSAICTTTWLLILLSISSSISPLVCVGHTWASCTRCWCCLMTLHLIATRILRIIILLILSMLHLHLIDTSVRVTTCTWRTILLLRILLELVRHITMCTITYSTPCLSEVSILIIGSLREVLRRNCSWTYVLVLGAETANIGGSSIVLSATGSAKSSLKCIWRHIVLIIETYLT